MKFAIYGENVTINDTMRRKTFRAEQVCRH